MTPEEAGKRIERLEEEIEELRKWRANIQIMVNDFKAYLEEILP